MQRDRDGGERVLDIVAARHGQIDALYRAAVPVTVADHDIEAVAVGARHDVGAAHIGLRGKAVGDDAAVADARDDRLHLRMIEAEHRRAVEGDILDEFDEGVLDRVEAAIMVEMFGIDIGDDGDGAVEP